MNSTCAYCSNLFRGARITKKYCSDNCRQMAYLSRKGYTVVSGVKPATLKEPIYTTDVNKVFYAKNIVNHSNGVNNDVKNTLGVKDITRVKMLTEQSISKSEFPFEDLIARLDVLIESKITKAVNTLREEITAKYSREIEQNLSTVNYCKPCTINDFSLTSSAIQVNKDEVKSTITSNGNDEQKKENSFYDNEQDFCNENYEVKSSIEIKSPEPEENEGDSANDVYAELQAAELHIQKLEQELYETKSQMLESIAMKAQLEQKSTKNSGDKAVEEVNGISKTLSEEPKENEAETHQTQTEMPSDQIDKTDILEETKFYPGNIPLLHELISHELERGEAYKFARPFEHWQISEVKDIAWVNVRLRCLFVALVKASNLSSVKKEAFTQLVNGFISVHNSSAFQKLPADYPYTNIFSEVTHWLRQIATNRSGSSNITFRFTVKRKAVVTAIACELEPYTERVKFSELTFEEILPETKKQDPEKYAKYQRWAIAVEQHKKKYTDVKQLSEYELEQKRRQRSEYLQSLNK